MIKTIAGPIPFNDIDSLANALATLKTIAVSLNPNAAIYVFTDQPTNGNLYLQSQKTSFIITSQLYTTPPGNIHDYVYSD